MHNQPYVGRVSLCARKKLLKSGEIRDFYGIWSVTSLLMRAKCFGPVRVINSPYI